MPSPSGVGGLAGVYIEMWEFDSMTDLEKCEVKEVEDEDSMKIQSLCYW